MSAALYCAAVLALVVLAVVWWRRAPAETNTAASKAIPAGVLEKIDPSGAASISVYLYRGVEVLYVKPRGFDVFNSVYSMSGERLGSPDGGFTGQGDGTLPDWGAEARLVRHLRQAQML